MDYAGTEPKALHPNYLKQQEERNGSAKSELTATSETDAEDTTLQAPEETATALTDGATLEASLSDDVQSPEVTASATV